VQTLDGHTQNVSAVCFHPEYPIIISGSEDGMFCSLHVVVMTWFMFMMVGTLRIWHSGTYRLETTLNYGMERVWSMACRRGSNHIAIGYDEGSILLKVGRNDDGFVAEVNH
jgi:coatomer subunit beta'